MDRDKAIAPVAAQEAYLKYGFVLMRHQVFYCPTCNCVLNVGPVYLPNYCDQCGQRLDFSNVIHEADEFIQYIDHKH